MKPLTRLEDEPPFGAIFLQLIKSAFLSDSPGRLLRIRFDARILTFSRIANRLFIEIIEKKSVCMEPVNNRRQTAPASVYACWVQHLERPACCRLQLNGN